MGYLLDTNIISDMMRHTHGKAELRIESVGPENVYTSILVIAELRFGLQKRNSERLSRRLQELAATIDVLDFNAPADEAYARLRNDLERAGKPIGAMDMLIAAQALAYDHVLVTANDHEFARIHGLQVENWLR